MVATNKRPVYGVGINDSETTIAKYKTIFLENGTKAKRAVWFCPFHKKWQAMLERCYSPRWHKKQPTYVGCTVCEEWKYFSNFRSWMETQDWEGKQLDKDILIEGNKVYSPETCVFVDQKVNKFLTERGNDRGRYMLGVHIKPSGLYFACCNSVVTNKQVYLGAYQTEKEAHLVWLEYKLSQAIILAEEQTDERVSKALINRYESRLKNFLSFFA